MSTWQRILTNASESLSLITNHVRAQLGLANSDALNTSSVAQTKAGDLSVNGNVRANEYHIGTARKDANWDDAYNHSQAAHAPTTVATTSANGLMSSGDKALFTNLVDGGSNLPYRHDLMVYGDSDKYYPVHFARGNQFLLRTIKIWRGFNETAPNDWNTATHRGSLNLEWKGNYGNWGGASYQQWIYEHSEMYATLLGGTLLVEHGYGIAIFLRGGGADGAIYHIASDQPLSWFVDSWAPTYGVPTPFYNEDLTFAHPDAVHRRYAPAPKTAPDIAQLNSIKVVRNVDRANTAYAHSQVTHAPTTVATTSADGLMSSTDKSNLTNVVSDISTHKVDATLHTPSSGITGHFLVKTPNGSTWQAGSTSSHTHGDISFDGKIGTSEGKPLITASGGAIKAGSFGQNAGQFCEGNDGRLSNARPPTAHNHDASNIMTGTINRARLGSGTPNSTNFLRGDGTWAVPAGGGGGSTEILLATPLDTVTGNLQSKKVILQNETNTKAEAMSVEDIFSNMSKYAGSGEYGVRYYDDGTKYVYERVGTIGGVAAGNLNVPESLLTVHNKMARCVTKADGTINYYLNASNSMYKAGGEVALNEGNATIHTDNFGAGTFVFTGVSVPSNVVGSYCNLYDVAGTRKWYALVTGVSGNNITLSHPHCNNFGKDSGGAWCGKYIIGDAKLDGSDGQVMVEIPEFYWRHRDYREAGKNYIEHIVSLSPMVGGVKFEKRYISAFEGVEATSASVPFNSWTGTWNAGAKRWSSIGGNIGTPVSDTSSNFVADSKLFSVAGYYPTILRSRREIRLASNNTGDKYHQYSFWDNFVLQLFMLVEMGSFKSQTIIGAGVTNITSGLGDYNGSRPIRKTGDTVFAGNQTIAMNNDNFKYDIASSINRKIESLSYRGIENPYGHIWKWVDAVNLRWFVDGVARYAQAFLSENPRTHVDWASDLADPDVTNFVKLPTRIYTHMNSSGTHGYIKNVSKEFLPTTGHGQSSVAGNYVDDFFWVPPYMGAGTSMNRVLAVGGLSSSSARAGAWYRTSWYGSVSRDPFIGGRLSMKG